MYDPNPDFEEPEPPDPSDDEGEADVNPVEVCRYCGSRDCTGTCYGLLGFNTP